jgi:hypothetical protein
MDETENTGLILDGLSESQLLDDRQAASAMTLQPGTLAVWRSTGRVNLPYIKVGRSVRYRVGDIRKFLESRTRLHTGES